MLLLTKKITSSMLLLLIAVVLGGSKDFLGQGLSGYFSFIASNTTTAAHVISSLVSFIAVIVLVVAVILFIIGYTIARLQYRNYTFTLEEYDLKLKRGIFDIEEVSIPYRQIQSVDITKPFVYDLFGVCRLVLMTAGHEEADAKDESDTVFDPIDKDIAVEIRELLQKRIGVQIIVSDPSKKPNSTTITK